MGRNRLRVYVHFVWATWDRRPLVTDEIRESLYRYIQGVCRARDCPVLALGGRPDHVHLLIAWPNTVTFAELMGAVKGGSSRYATEELLGGRWFAWQGGYGASSVCPRHKATVVRYIENQQAHHASGSLWPDAEETQERDP